VSRVSVNAKALKTFIAFARCDFQSFKHEFCRTPAQENAIDSFFEEQVAALDIQEITTCDGPHVGDEVSVNGKVFRITSIAESK
jgi:hypothetical protein